MCGSGDSNTHTSSSLDSVTCGRTGSIFVFSVYMSPIYACWFVMFTVVQTSFKVKQKYVLRECKLSLRRVMPRKRSVLFRQVNYCGRYNQPNKVFVDEALRDVSRKCLHHKFIRLLAPSVASCWLRLKRPHCPSNTLPAHPGYTLQCCSGIALTVMQQKM